MKKSILNLKGAQELSKNEQKSVNGGKNYACGSIGSVFCNSSEDCGTLANPGICSSGCCVIRASFN